MLPSLSVMTYSVDPSSRQPAKCEYCSTSKDFLPADQSEYKLLSLMGKRDYTKVASGGSMVNCLLKPLTLEMKSGQTLIIRMRQECMRELLENEFAEQKLAFKHTHTFVPRKR